MNGFANHADLDDVSFGEPKSTGLKSFDAFPKVKQTYLTTSRTGSAWTLLLIVACTTLVISESRRWFAGTTTQAFTVEKGVSHDLQLNLDIVVAMQCQDIHINIQDAAGDRVLAGDLLTKDATRWSQWQGKKVHHLHDGSDEEPTGMSADKIWHESGAAYGKGENEDVHDYLDLAKKKKKYKKTPSLKGEADACRIYGSVEGNKVQGDFHITARGHGYLEFAPHLDHDSTSTPRCSSSVVN